MMTMSLGDEAPWIYLPRRGSSQGQPHWDLVGPSFLHPHRDSTRLHRAAPTWAYRVLGTEDTVFNKTVPAHDMSDRGSQHINDP